MTDKTYLGSSDENRIRQRIHQGKFREALVICIQEYGSEIGRFCMAMLGDQAESEDTVNEVFVELYDTVADLEKNGNIRLRLFEIARRLCARRMEVRISNNPPNPSGVESEAKGDAHDPGVDKQPFVNWIRKALDVLRPSERDSVILRYQAGLSYREIAEICHKDEGLAVKQTSRALLRLRTYLKDKIVV
ncbi:MAG: sigma-70 family RNA polymerase sigma factor [Deltaproteobacteria bacterium]|nr:sigma-70 family RNA polymerase sigma factor [Deltaproteobacteria bacterium]